MRRALPFFAILGLLAAGAPPRAQQPPAPPPGPVVAADVARRLAAEPEARVVILLDLPAFDRRDLGRLQDEVARAQDRVLERLRAGDFMLRRRFRAVPLLAGTLAAAGLEGLRGAPGVLRVDLEMEASAVLLQSVPLIEADAVQALGFTGEGVTVGVIDTGIDSDHPDLADDLDGQACFCVSGGGCCPGGGTSRFGPGAAEDDNGHGTHVAGIVTSAGRVAPRGVAPDAQIVAVKVLDSDGFTCCSSDIVAGLDWILVNRPDVDAINVSIGSNALYPGDCDGIDSTTSGYARAIEALRDRGVAVFVASGNSASGGGMSAPACVSAALSVGAVYDANVGSLFFQACTDSTTAPDQVACFSNSNATTDLFAPGGRITAPYLGGGVASLFGTSMAAPHAAGCAADVLQADPGLGALALEATLEATGRPVTDPKNGLTFPRVDCLAAVQARSCPDGDGDGFWMPAGPGCPGGVYADCDDGAPERFPGNPEVCDRSDNDCDEIIDEGFDPDADGLAACVDNCPLHANAAQGDRDADGQGDACDLDDGFIDVTVDGPGPVRWQPEIGFTAFNLYRGALGAFVDTDGDGAADDYGSCLAEDLPGPVFDDPSMPAAGEGFFYLVTGKDAAGEGSLGRASSGALRPNVRDCSQVFGVPPEIDSLTLAATLEQVACDFTQIAEALICSLGVPGARAIAPIVIGGAYTQVRLEALVLDADSAPGSTDVARVTATLVRAGAGDLSTDLYDDGSATAFLESQKGAVGEDCAIEPGGCVCQAKIFALDSRDTVAADSLYTRGLAFVEPSLPGYLQDCIMSDRRLTPLLATMGSTIEVRLTAGDRAGHHATWPAPPSFAPFAGSYSCGGDACGCCLLIAGDPVSECRGLEGMVAPDFPGGICASF